MLYILRLESLPRKATSPSSKVMLDQDPAYNKSHGALSESSGTSVGKIVEPRLMRLNRGALLLKNPSTST